MTVNTALEMFSLACLHKNEGMINILCEDIVKQFKVFARASMFLEIPFNNLKMIVEKLLLSTENEDVLLGAVLRWFSHCRDKRSTYIF